ncbi:hemoglobin subunit alpha-5-like [Discoglossus pictus]
MVFSESEKIALQCIWSKVSGHAEDVGAEAMDRLFHTRPATKTYFSHLNTSSGSADLRCQGGKVINAIGKAIEHLDDIEHALSDLADLHAQKLKVDPGNFALLSHCILVVLGRMYPHDFTPVAHRAWDKLLSVVSCTLVSKYR